MFPDKLNISNSDDTSRSRLLVAGLNQWDWEIYFVNKIVSSLDMDLVFWEVESVTENLARNLFPQAEIMNNSGGKEKRFQYFSKHDWPLVDPAVVKELSVHELELWPSFLRNAQLRGWRGDMSLKDEYHRAITFRYYFIKHYRPDVYLFGNVPTGFYAFLDYLLCKRLSVTTVLLRRIEVPGFYAMPIMSIEQPGDYLRILESEPEQDPKISNREVQDYMISLTSNYDQAMPQVYGRKGGFGAAYKLDKRTGKLKESEFWIPRILKETFEQPCNKVKYLVRALGYYSYRKFLLHAYNKYVADELNTDCPYILVNLHYQPEASSIPLGGIYAYQELMISLLSRTVPEDWLIYVKEHPTHLLNNRFNFSLKFRHQRFYKNISQYKNVRLVSVTMNNFFLIDSSKAVATLTGTSGFEAINRGVPCLAFGFPWYMYADGCFSVQNETELKEALLMIQNGYEPSLSKVHEFVNLVLSSSIPGMFLQDDGVCSESGQSVREYGEQRADQFLKIWNHQIN